MMITIENLSKRYGNLWAVQELDLHIPKGELFCFLGPNGAGKTTTIKVLTGLLKPTVGKASIAGFDVREQPMEAKKRVGYIPDMPYLYDRLTPVEFFEFTAELYGVPREEIKQRQEALFALFGLNEYRAAMIKGLSHGMRQRLIYASTFLHEPEVLFVDEPLIGLDPKTIRERTRAGMTIFLTTHILALAQDIADRIGIILHGRLVVLGTLSEILDQYCPGGTLEEAFLSITREEEGVSD
jgi:ABC-2 type transport system ATP-binding protein